MRSVVYPAVFDNSDNGEKEYYSVEFPDLDGVFSEGHGLAESMMNASEALGLALYNVPDNKLPHPTSIGKIQEICRTNYPNAKVYPVAVDLDKAAEEVVPVMVKKNTRIPGKLAKQAEKAGINFSKTLTEALEEKLAHN